MAKKYPYRCPCCNGEGEFFNDIVVGFYLYVTCSYCDGNRRVSFRLWKRWMKFYAKNPK
jgi:DnaJ-class molecular chaperone